MDTIVNRLSEIEQAATSILEAAEVEKKELEKQSAASLDAYDNQLAQQTNEKLAKLQAALDAQMEKELAQIQEKTECIIQTFENDYQSNHEKLAKQLFERIIEG